MSSLPDDGSVKKVEILQTDWISYLGTMHLFGICFLVYMMKISAPKGMRINFSETFFRGIGLFSAFLDEN